MKKNHSNSSMNPKLWMSLAVLLASFTLVHFLYVGVVIPNAEAAILALGSEAQKNIWVILKDTEQKICISIMLYGFFLMAYKLTKLIDEEAIYTRDFLQSHDKTQSLDVDLALSELEGSAYSENPAMATWINCIRRFKNTQNVQHAADAIDSSVDSLAASLESGNGMLKYITWAIPSIGFIGTVRGIGSALGSADKAINQGDIAGMVEYLGVAFNSTLVGIFISLILMFFMHLLNGRQDEMVLRTKASCEKHLLSHLHE